VKESKQTDHLMDWKAPGDVDLKLDRHLFQNEHGYADNYLQTHDLLGERTAKENFKLNLVVKYI